jgi:hypothetical protein
MESVGGQTKSYYDSHKRVGHGDSSHLLFCLQSLAKQIILICMPIQTGRFIGLVNFSVAGLEDPAPLVKPLACNS